MVKIGSAAGLCVNKVLIIKRAILQWARSSRQTASLQPQKAWSSIDYDTMTVSKELEGRMGLHHVADDQERQLHESCCKGELNCAHYERMKKLFV